MKDGINKRIIKRHPDSKTKIRKWILNLTKMKQSLNSYLHKQKVRSVVVERNDIYPQYDNERINQRQNDISTKLASNIAWLR